jgi:hypothetical protein
MDKGVRIRMDFHRMCELCVMYRQIIAEYECSNDHAELLLAHIKHLHHRLRMLAVKEQATYLFSLNDMEAIAFEHTWKEMAYAPGAWRGQIIKSIMDAINKYFTTKSRQIWTV